MAPRSRGCPRDRAPRSAPPRASRSSARCAGGAAEAGTISGRDIYGLTAALISRGARIAAGRGFSGRGGLAPSQAFEPRSFLEGLERFGIEWEVEAGAEPTGAGGVSR